MQDLLFLAAAAHGPSPASKITLVKQKYPWSIFSYLGVSFEIQGYEFSIIMKGYPRDIPGHYSCISENAKLVPWIDCHHRQDVAISLGSPWDFHR